MAKRRVADDHLAPPVLTDAVNPFVLVGGGKDPWFRSILTDHNGDFDLGAVLVGVVAIFMCLNAGYDTTVLHRTFDAQAFGIGIGAMLGGFAAYKVGDRRQAGTVTTTATATTTTTPAAGPPIR